MCGNPWVSAVVPHIHVATVASKRVSPIQTTRKGPEATAHCMLNVVLSNPPVNCERMMCAVCCARCAFRYDAVTAAGQLQYMH